MELIATSLFLVSVFRFHISNPILLVIFLSKAASAVGAKDGNLTQLFLAVAFAKELYLKVFRSFIFERQRIKRGCI